MTTKTRVSRLPDGDSIRLLRPKFGNGGLFSQGVFALVIKVAGAGLSFTMFMAIARSLSEAEFGVVGTVFSLATIAAAVGSMGQRVTSVRLVASYDEQGRAAKRRGVMRFSYGVLTAGTLIAGVVAALWVRQSPDIPGHPTFLLAVVLLALALGVSDLQTRVLRPITGVGLTLIPKDVLWRGIILAVGSLAVLFWPAGTMSAVSWIWFLGLSLLGVTAVQLGFFERRHPTLSAVRGSASYAPRSWLAESRAPWVTVIALTAGPSLAVVLVGVDLSIEESGPFFAAVRIAQLLTLFMHAIEVVLSPNISRDLVSGRFDSLQRSCRTAAGLGGSFALAGWLVFAVAGGAVLDLFRDGFSSQRGALIVLSFGYLVNAMAGPTAPLLLMSGRASSLARYQIVSWVVGLAALLPAIRMFGTLGAAVVLATADIAWNVAARRLIRKEMKIESTVLALFRSPHSAEIGVDSDG